MRFLIKLGFWLTLVLMIIPFKPANDTDPANAVAPAEAYAAARDTVADFGQFCTRRPEVCRFGKATLTTMGKRAREGARLAYEYLDEKLGPDGSLPHDAIETGTVKQGE